MCWVQRLAYSSLPHRKTTRIHPDHFQVYGGVELSEMVYYPDGAGGVGFVAGGITYGIGTRV